MQVCLLSSMNLVRTVLFFTLTFSTIACQKNIHADAIEGSDHNIVLQFKPVVQYDSVDMEFGTAYKNYFNESFTVTKFKFYVHDIAFINTDSNKVFRINTNQYYLVDFADSASTEVKLGIMPFKYNRLTITLGVDSLNSVKGNQTGALDPANGMYWNSSNGYIAAWLEGTSPQSSASGSKFNYQVGGYTQSESATKIITLLFPYGETVDMQSASTTRLTITADVYDWFNSPHDIKISVNPVCPVPGTLARQIAENYSKMFTVVEINNE